MIDNNTYNMKAYLQKTDTKMSGADSKNKFQISILKDTSILQIGTLFIQ